MLLGVGRHLVVAVTSAIGALALAAVAESLIWRYFPTEPVVTCTPTVLMLALDRSGSMIEGPEPKKLQRVQDAVMRFVARAGDDVCAADLRVGLVTFARDATLDVAPTSDLDAFAASVSATVALGGTIIENGIDAAVGALSDADFADWRKMLFLLTDAENHDSDEIPLAAALVAALAAGVEVRAVVTEEGEHIDAIRDVLGSDRVMSAEDETIGETFFAQAEETVFISSVIIPERHYSATVLWTGLVTAGIALALLVYLNRFNKRKRLFTGRDGLAVLAALALGIGIGAIAQYLPSLAATANLWAASEDGGRRQVGDLLVWALIGLLLTTGLAGFRILPNRRLLNAVAFGLIGGLAAGLAYVALVDVNVADGYQYLPRLVAAAALGATIGFAFNLFSESSAQYPLWLRIHYVSDRVDRYHPIGTTPVTVGAGSKADVYVPGDHDVVWRFWVEGRRIVIDNVSAGTRRSLDFADVSRRGAIELMGVTLKIVDDVGPERGRSR